MGKSRLVGDNKGAALMWWLDVGEAVFGWIWIMGLVLELIGEIKKDGR